MDDKLVMSVPAAGKLLSLSRCTAYKLAHTGEIPTIRMGRKLLVPKQGLEHLLNGESKPKEVKEGMNDGHLETAK
jgi:excisionase family DNA binding protein